MQLHRKFLFYAIVAMSVVPAVAQTSSSGSPSRDATETTSIPDFTGTWQHPVFPWFEPPASGPGPITNLSRWPQRVVEGGQAPTKEGVSDYDQLVGDYKNPILQPWAAEIVKKAGEMSLAGITTPNPSNQCQPMPMPFTFKNFVVVVLQEKAMITLLYANPQHDIRRIRLNASHPKKLTPSWYGDSIGHYEGETLVIDTVGTKTDRPFAMIDLYGTPYTKALHVVERYRLIDYDAAKEGLERDARENRLVPGDIDPAHRGKFLQVKFTVEDEGAFTTPWTATITYRPAPGPWQEIVCAENQHEYYYNKDSEVPTAGKPDF